MVYKAQKLRSCSCDHPNKYGNSMIKRRHFLKWKKNHTYFICSNSERREHELEIALHQKKAFWLDWWRNDDGADFNRTKRGLKTAAASSTTTKNRLAKVFYSLRNVCVFTQYELNHWMRIAIQQKREIQTMLWHEPRKQSNIMSNFVIELSLAQLTVKVTSMLLFSHQRRI